MSNDRTLLAAVDDFGALKLFRYPVVQKDSKSNDSTAHGGNVVKVKWSKDDKYIFTLGASDKTLCVWEVSELKKATADD